MTDNKQYPPLPDFEEVEQHVYWVSRGYIPRGMLEPIHELMRAYVDADRAMRAAQAAPAAVAVPDDRCQHCVNRSDGFYGSFAPECPLHNDDGTAHTQAAPQPVEHPLVASDTMRADLIADLHDVFDANGPETPQIVRDVIEYADSWLQVVIQRKAESPTQPAAPASQDAEDAARYRCWRDAMIEDVGLQFIKAVSRALPDAVGVDRRPTAHEWDAAINAARAAKEREQWLRQ